MKKILIIFILTVVILFVPSTVFAKDYSIESADFDVRINWDGSADIIETRTYDFDGSFTWADEWIFTKGYSISDIKMSGPDNFGVSPSPDKLYIKWFYSARNERKTFTLFYTIKNAVTNQTDISEFYWQLVGDEWKKRTGQVNAKIHLAYPVPDAKIWAFGHGPLNGKINIVSNQEVDFEAKNLPPEKFFEIRILFPTNSFFVNARTGDKTLDSILSEEKIFVLKTKAKGLIFLIIIVVVAAISVWRFIHWLLVLKKLGISKLPPPSNLAGMLHEPPDDLPPAMVETLLSPSNIPTGRSIVATIIELARRKTLRIDFVKDGKKTFFGKKDQYFLSLADFDYEDKVNDLEKKIIELLFSVEDKKIDFDDIKNFGRKHPDRTFSFWEGFKKSAKWQLVEQGYLLRTNIILRDKAYMEAKGWLFVLFFGIVFTFMSAISGSEFIISIVMAPVFLTSAVLIAIVGKMMNVRTETGDRELGEWRAFKKWLKNYSVTKNYPIDSVILWEKYLVYGTALGISIKSLSQLPIKYSDDYRNSGVYLHGYVGPPGAGLINIQLLGSLSSFFTTSGALGVGVRGVFPGVGGGVVGGGGGGAG